MTIKRSALYTLAIMGSLMVSLPALAYNEGGAGRSNRPEAVEDQYSGSESTMVPVEPSTSFEEPMPLNTGNDRSNK